LGDMQAKLQAAGVEVLGVVATQPARARLYLRFRPTPYPLGADPDLTTHRLYGLPNIPMTSDLMQLMQAVRVNPTGELPEPLPLSEVGNALNRLDGFTPTRTDEEENQRHGAQLVGQFLIDQEGIVRWSNIEGAKEGLTGFGLFPSAEELLAAARML